MKSFFNFNRKVTVNTGVLLLSEPFLPDPNFERSVVLVTEHNDMGTVGFVMNKSTEHILCEAIPEINDIQLPIYLGGPVEQNTLHVVHNQPDVKDTIEICEGVYWGGDFDQIIQMISVGIQDMHCRFFVGYSGWAPGQLDEEIQQNSWIVAEHFDPKKIYLSNDSQMWREIVRSLGGRFQYYSDYPVDPSLN